MKSDSFVSTLIVLDKPLVQFADKILEIQSSLDIAYSDYEIVIIGQGPVKKNSSNIEELLNKIPSIRYIQLSAKVESNVAWAAALENSIGDYVVLFNHESDPVKAINETVRLCKSGNDIVIGVAHRQSTFLYKVFRKVAAFILSQIDYSLPRNATDLRCLSRRAVNSVTATGRFHHQIAMRMQKTGYQHCIYNYSFENKNLKNRKITKAFRDLLRLMVFNSSRPLRWMSFLGLLGSFSAFIFASYSILIHLIKGHVAEGWTTTILFMSSMFMLQFLMMAFFGEYIGRLLDDRSEQDDFSVVFEKNSSVMVNRDRVNVLNKSLNDDVN
jgi:hypothetical protein